MWERGKQNFSSFPHYFIYISNLGVKLHILLLNVVFRFIVFLILSTLICRGTDISNCFSTSLGIRDNESRLYFLLMFLNYCFRYGKQCRSCSTLFAKAKLFQNLDLLRYIVTCSPNFLIDRKSSERSTRAKNPRFLQENSED